MSAAVWSSGCCLRFGALAVGRWDGVLVRGASQRSPILSPRWSRARTRSRCCSPTTMSGASLCMRLSTGANGPLPAGWATRWRSRISPRVAPPPRLALPRLALPPVTPPPRLTSPCLTRAMRWTLRRLALPPSTQSPGRRLLQRIAARVDSTKLRHWPAARLGRWECVRRSCSGASARQRSQAPAAKCDWQVLALKAARGLADAGSCLWTTWSPPAPRCERQRLRWWVRGHRPSMWQRVLDGVATASPLLPNMALPSVRAGRQPPCACSESRGDAHHHHGSQSSGSRRCSGCGRAEDRGTGSIRRWAGSCRSGIPGGEESAHR